MDEHVKPPIRYYGRFDREGVPLGFWSSEVFPAPHGRLRHPNIPRDAVELPEAQWRELIGNQPRARFVNGKVNVLPQQQPPPPPPGPFDELRDMVLELGKRIEALERR